MNMKKLLLFAVVFVAARPVYAEINFGYTAEWLSHESAVIALATPLKVENTKGPGDVWFTKTQFQLIDVIKGPQSNGDTITIYDFSYKTSDALSLDKAKKESKQLLVFARVAEHMLKQIDGKYVFTQVQQFKSAYYTDQPVTKLYTPDFGLLTTFNDLLKRTKEQATHEATLLRQYWKGTIVKKSLDVPGDSEAYRDLWAGSACFLWVPEYKKEQTSNKTDAPDDDTLAKLANGMTEAQIETILGVAGRHRENAPLQTMEYDFNGQSVWVEFASSSEDKTPRATAIRSRKDGLTIAAREAIRMKKWSEWVAAHQRKTNGIPNQSSDATAKPVSIKSATPNDFKNMLLLASGDGSSRYFIGFSEEWAYCEAKDGRGNVTIYVARTSDLDKKLLADLGAEIQKRFEADKSKNGNPVQP